MRPAAAAAHTSAYAIIGNGIAGITAAEILREGDAQAEITVIADDPYPAYYRPALKDYLAGRVHEDKLWARPGNFYQTHGIRFLRERVVGLQIEPHMLELQSGARLTYRQLLLAQGARAGTLACPGLNLSGVVTLRTVADYQQVEGYLNQVEHVVVVGSGTLALETIETLRHRGYRVTHLLRKHILWSEVLDATASDLVLQQERRDGVEVREGEELVEIYGKEGRVRGVATTTGTRMSCELVIVAVGIEPVIDFVKRGGLSCGRGIKVDPSMRTSAPDIYAAGDVLETTDPLTGRTRVIGQWYPAIQQARAAAYAMLGVLDTTHRFQSSTFYNASFLYGLDFAAVGMTTLRADQRGYQEIVADPRPRCYQKIILQGGIPLGMVALGERKNVLACKRAIDYRVDLSPILGQLFAPTFQLSAWLDKQGVPPPLLGVRRQGEPGKSERSGVVVNAPASPSPSPAPQPRRFPPVPVMQQARLLSAEGQVLLTLKQEPELLVGREAGLALRLEHRSVSRRHACLRFVEQRYLLEDLGSTNGTFLNGTRLVKGTTHPLSPNDTLRFGDIVCTFTVSQERTPLPASLATPVPAVPAPKTSFLDLAEIKAGIAARQPRLTPHGELQFPEAVQTLSAAVVASLQTSPALILIRDGKPEVFYLRAPGRANGREGLRLRIGRERDNEIVLTDAAVSRHHAELVPDPNGFSLYDLKSSNGVLVNQTKITNPYRLAHGDRILIGNSVCYFLWSRPSVLAGEEAVPPQAQQQGSLPICRVCGAAGRHSAALFCQTCGAPFNRQLQEVKHA